MKTKPSTHRLFIILIVAALSLGLNACQSMGTIFSAAPIAPEKRIALKPTGPHQGLADTGDIEVDYIFQMGPDSRLRVTGGIRSIRFRADVANVYLNFLDDTGHVISKKLLYASGNRRDVYTSPPSTFDTTLPLPPGTVAIAFSSYIKASTGNN